MTRRYRPIHAAYMGIDHRDWDQKCKFCDSPLDWLYANEIAGSGMPQKDVIFESVCTNNCRAYQRSGETGARNKKHRVSAVWEPIPARNSPGLRVREVIDAELRLIAAVGRAIRDAGRASAVPGRSRRAARRTAGGVPHTALIDGALSGLGDLGGRRSNEARRSNRTSSMFRTDRLRFADNHIA